MRLTTKKGLIKNTIGVLNTIIIITIIVIQYVNFYGANPRKPEYNDVVNQQLKIIEVNMERIWLH